MKYITDVAIMYEGEIYALPRPNRHHDVIRLIYSENGVGINGPDVQGFLTNFGEFLTREQAVSVATAAGQADIAKIRGGKLYSEDIW